MNSRLTKALGFDTVTEQGSIRPESVNFGLGKTPRLDLWTGAYCHNGVFAFGDKPNVFFEIVKHAGRLSSSEFKTRITSKQSARKPKVQYKESGFKESGETVFYDFTNDFQQSGERLQKTHRSFTYCQPESILHLLTDLQEFRLRVQDKYKNIPYGAVSRKVVLAFLYLNDDVMNELKQNIKAMQVLKDIFINGQQERVALLLVVKQAKVLPKEFFSTSDMTWFVGEDNISFAEKHYKLPVYKKHFGLVHVGVLWSKMNPDELRSFCAMTSDREDWLIDKKKILKEQDDDWNAFLAELDKERNQ